MGLTFKEIWLTFKKLPQGDDGVTYKAGLMRQQSKVKEEHKTVEKGKRIKMVA